MVLCPLAVKIFLNAEGDLSKVSEKLQAFLRFIRTNKPGDTFTERLYDEAKAAVRAEKWRVEYMSYGAKMYDVYHTAFDSGYDSGYNKFLFETIENAYHRGDSIAEICKWMSLPEEDVEKVIEEIKKTEMQQV